MGDEGDIAAGAVDAKTPSSVEFIEKASGIKSRYVVEKSGVVDPAIMRPIIPERPNEDISILAEIGGIHDHAGGLEHQLDRCLCRRIVFNQ